MTEGSEETHGTVPMSVDTTEAEIHFLFNVTVEVVWKGLAAVPERSAQVTPCVIW